MRIISVVGLICTIMLFISVKSIPIYDRKEIITVLAANDIDRNTSLPKELWDTIFEYNHHWDTQFCSFNRSGDAIWLNGTNNIKGIHILKSRVSAKVST